MWRGRFLRSIRASWVDIAWVVFVGLNLIAMHLIPEWQTIPFLIIWVSLTAIYGFRLWQLGSTVLTVAAVTLATGGLIGWQVLQGQEDVEYLAEVPLLAVMFVVMVWHARRRLAALEEVKRFSEHNVRLLEQQRRFLQDASHELRTPITVALGHTELVERAVTDPGIAEDARVAVDELLRLRRLANRLLLLASAESPDFLRLAPIEAEDLVVEALSRWSHTSRRWSMGELEEAAVQGDRDRHVVLAVADWGIGIPAAEVDRIFDRFARVDSHRNRQSGGFGLGLDIVKVIAEAHGGSVRARSTEGSGSVFELVLAESKARVGPTLGGGSSGSADGWAPG